MFSSTPKAVLFSFLLSLSSTAVSGQSSDSACTDVHIFMARGNGESYPGRVGLIANAICEDQGGQSCDAENIIFDSSLSYVDQLDGGVSSGTTQINTYADRCPSAKIVVAGYSLGAHIVGDILGGGGGNFYGEEEPTTSEMSASTVPGDRISAVLLFGNPRHVAGESYNVGTGSGENGQYPRQGGQLAGLNQYAGIMQDYCLYTDPICALGDDGESHTTYMTIYASTAGAWVAQLFAGGYVVSTSTAAAPTTVAPSTSSTVAAASTSSSVVIDSTSSFSYAASSSSSSGSESFSFSAAASTSSSSSSTSVTSSASTSSVTFAPFVFSNTATVATTSVFLPTTASSTFVPSTTFSSVIVVTSSKVISTPLPTLTPSSVGAITTSFGNSTSAPISSVTSHAGAYSNAVGITMNLVAVIVVKALVF